jgi:purine-nucleoside phosphorylase
MQSSNVLDSIKKSEKYLKAILKGTPLPETLVILGSGFSNFAKTLKNRLEINYSEIPGFPISSVKGHGRSLIVGDSNKTKICVLTGRCHMYEGFSAHEVVHPLRVLARLGIKKVLLTNASGSLVKSIAPGSLVLITDQINLTGRSCLIDSRSLGEEFVDMTNAYNLDWQKKILRKNKKLKKGVYLGVLGPAYETPAEAKAYATLGAHIVGMSTVQETIAARQLGLKVSGISMVTNMSGGIGHTQHSDVLKLAQNNHKEITKILSEIAAL